MLLIIVAILAVLSLVLTIAGTVQNRDVPKKMWKQINNTLAENDDYWIRQIEYVRKNQEKLDYKLTLLEKYLHITVTTEPSNTYYKKVK